MRNQECDCDGISAVGGSLERSIEKAKIAESGSCATGFMGLGAFRGR